MIHDVIVVGGSFAGLAAATQIARARRKVLVIDAGLRRNRFASVSHGFLAQDGRAPGEIIADAREQLMAYDTVEMAGGTAASARKDETGFVVTMGNGELHRGKRLVLATGIVDTLPDIPGISERWGKHVFHCPYCHGYEIGMGKIGVIAVGPLSIHQALLVADWGETTLLTHGSFEPDDEQQAALAARGVAIESAVIAEISGEADVRFSDGRVTSFDGLFTASRISMASPLAEQLGCAFADGPLGAVIETSGGIMQTSVDGVFACGDAMRAAGSVSLAVADGAMAGVAAHRSLIFP
jgi:thioredoxin reductase